MDLRQLEMFRMVAETESFTRAGEKLYVSHSAISRQVKLLEDELGVLLFTRANKRVSLTEPGKAMLEHVKAIFERVAQTVESVSRMSTAVVPHLNVGTGTTMLSFFLPPVFKEFRKRYPAVSVHVRTGQWPTILQDVRRGALDMVIGSLPMPIEGREFLVEPLYREELVVVVGSRHPFARKKMIRPDELNNFPLIAFPPDSTTRRILEDLFRELRISPCVALEVENDEAVEKAISMNTAISFLPKRRASQDRIHFLRITGHEVFRNVGFVCLRSKQSLEHVSYFSTLCCEQAKRAFPSDCLCH
jgi:DNA-binding transcriptional LysR family regulator